ncbi:MAG TPA: YdeI/OmpD-associated family protein [Thermomicrobiales bacterium]|jgi:hypothetical protein|nr:YdeI/OmpD-associated family protein [Thermomicrobiales bacterium]
MTTFTATLELGGKAATGIEIPATIIESLGAGKRPPVVATINGYSYTSTIGVMAGRFMLPVSAEHRTGAGISAGDTVEVTLALDTEPREVTLPDDLAAAMSADPAVRAAFDALSYSNRRRHVLQVEGAKTAETRARRVAKVVEALRTDGRPAPSTGQEATP